MLHDQYTGFRRLASITNEWIRREKIIKEGNKNLWSKDKLVLLTKYIFYVTKKRLYVLTN